MTTAEVADRAAAVVEPAAMEVLAVRRVAIFGRQYELVRPRLADPRFHLAAVIVTLHVLGQTVLDFDVSILQILVALVVAGSIGFVVAMARDRVIAWPASAVLAGNGVAFVLRVPGTQHGDWWSARGWPIFAATAALAVSSKFVIRWHGRHVFNPSNLALVVTFLILGSGHADPLPFWWGPISMATALALAIIVVGGVAILYRLRIAAIAASFWVAFASCVGLMSAAGHCMAAPWSLRPVCGRSLWWTLVSSPEVLVFMFFMITDPKTSPTGRVRRVCYGGGIGVLAALLIAPQTTEFATKVAILSALAIVCAARPFVERRLPEAGTQRDRLLAFLVRGANPVAIRLRPVVAVGALAALAGVLVAVAPNTVEATELARSVSGAKAVRPAFSSNELQLPAVVVDLSDRVAAAVPEEMAEAIGRDVTEDLAIVAQARRDRRVDLLATAAAEAELASLERELRSDLRAGTVDVTTYSLTRITISIARRIGQGPPAIMVTMTGTKTSSSDQRRSRPVHETYEVKWDGGHYLLVTDDLPLGFTPPR